MGAGATVLDLGCGVGHYGPPLRACGAAWRGYDGAENVVEATEGAVQWADITEPLFLGMDDWVMSLEVGEHLPAEYAKIYLDNVARHAQKGVVLSWAIPGQIGHGHINNQPNEWVVAQMRSRGFAFDAGASDGMRAIARLPWFRNTLMVFRRDRGVV